MMAPKISALLLSLLVLQGCQQHRDPFQPKWCGVLKDGLMVGRTPYTYTDSSTNGSSHVESQWNTGRTVASTALGIIFLFPFLGLLWAQDYQPDHHADMSTWDESEAARQRRVNAETAPQRP